MDIFSIAWIANKFPWFVYPALALALLLMAGYVTRYLWLSVAYIIAKNLVDLWADWQKEQAEVAKIRRLNELAITETRRKMIAATRLQLVSKWQDTDVEIEVQ